MAKVGFIGTGEIAEAMAHGLAGRGHNLLVSERNASRAAALAAALPEVSVAPNHGVLDGAEIVFLCLMKRDAEAALSALSFRADHRIVSVMVGLDLAALRRLCAPATEIALAIPMPFIARGACPVPVHPESAALRELFGDRNLVIPVATEAALNAHFAASALSSSVVDYMRAGSEWLAGLTGDAEGAEAYVTGLIAGYLAATPKDGKRRLAAILESLDRPGGLNTTLREHMRARGANAALAEGLDSLRPRLGLPPAE